MESKKLDFILYCDGACRGNPGPSSYGVLARLSDHTEIGRGGMFLGSGTNNSAEWQGAAAALQFAKEIVEGPALCPAPRVGRLDSPTGLAVGRVILRMDSLLVVKQLTGAWKIKEPRLRVFYNQAIAIVQRLNIPVEFEWVPREQNAEADKIANQCLDQRSTVGLKLTLAKSSAMPSAPRGSRGKSANRAGQRETSRARKSVKTRRVQFSLDEDTYTAFQQAARVNQSTTTQVLVDAVKHYLKS